MKPTVQQNAFFQEVQNGNTSILLEAVAGSGKTTSIMGCLPYTGNKTVKICAFNKSIAEEINTKLKKEGYDFRKASAGTVHSIGFGALRKLLGDVKIDAKKVRSLVDDLYEDFAHEDREELLNSVVKMVGLAKQAGIGPIYRIDDDQKWYDMMDHFEVINSDKIDPVLLKDMSVRVLNLSNKTRTVVDFDDMIYLPLLLKARFWQSDIVIVDEAQDLNETRRALVMAIVKPGGRVFVVGDRRQAIYGFTGADSNSLDLMQQITKAKRMPLSVCFRCDKDIVSFAQKWNPEIEAFEGKGQGKVSSMGYADFLKIENLSPNDVMLCRNTAPLVETAFALIKMGKAVRVEGRDIGENLKKLAQRWKVKTASALINKLDEFMARERQKFIEKKQEERIQSVEDKVETLKVIIDRCLESGKMMVSDVVSEIENLFEDSNGKKDVFTLSTGHKAKGREWERVFIFKFKETIPSPYAKKAWQLEQENNLAYVMATRAEHELVMVD